MERHLKSPQPYPQLSPGLAAGVLLAMVLLLACPAREHRVSPTLKLPDCRTNEASVRALPARPLATEESTEDSLEDHLALSDVHVFSLDLRQNDYLELAVKQISVDVLLELEQPDGTKIRADPFNLEDNFGKSEQLVWLAQASGRHRLYICAHPATRESGDYRVFVELRRPAGPRDQQEFAANWGYLEAVKLTRNNQPRESTILYEQALKIYQELGKHHFVASIYNNMGLNEMRLGDTEDALQFYAQALAIARENAFFGIEADALFNRASAHISRSDYEKALADFKQAEKVYSQLNGKGTKGIADSRSRQAGCYQALGQMDRALTLLQDALAEQQRIGDLAGQAETYRSLAWVHRDQGELQTALAELNQSLQLSGQSDMSRALTLNALGETYQQLGDPEEALRFYQQSRELFQRLGRARQEAAAISNIAHLQARLGRYQEALDSFKTTRPIFQQAGDRQSEATVLGNMAHAYGELRQAAAAEPLLGEALTLFTTIGDLQGQAFIFDEYGRLREQQKEWDAATEQFTRARTLAQGIGNQRIEAASLVGLAAVERERGDLVEALTHIETAIKITEALRTRVQEQELKALFFATRREYYELYVDLLLRLHEQDPQKGYAARALQVSEASRARALTDLLAEARLAVRRGIDPELKAQEQVLAARLAQLNTRLIELQSQSEPNLQEVERIRESLRQAEADQRHFEQELRHHHPRYANLQYPQPASLKEIQSLLGPKSALLEYSLGREVSYLFLVTNERLHVYRLPRAVEINAQVKDVQTFASHPSDLDADAQSFREQTENLLATLLPKSAQTELETRDQLLIAPDGGLYYLNFEILPTAAGSMTDFLERFRISYIPSATALANLRSAPADEPNRPALDFVGFGDPAYEMASAPNHTVRWPAGNASVSIEPLPASRHEVEAIRELFAPDRARIFLGHDASEENAKSPAFLPQARRLHFATHGDAREDRPQFSSLALTLDQDPAQDGLLQAYEIFNLDLAADLVVLSACETGKGKELRGEGLVGLSQAFFYAGAPSVVVSLWRVADVSTADLMVEFYRALVQGQSKAEALRQAKLKLRQQYAHPFYWAPFILMGRPD